MVRAAALVGRDGHFDVAVPGVARSAGVSVNGAAVVELDVGGAGREEVDPDGVAALRVDVAGHRGHEAGDVAGTAGHAEPRAARVLAVRFERIRVEERLAVERDAGDQAVVERALHDVDVLGVGVEQEEAVVPEIVADGGAGFVVGGHVRQLVVAAERLAGARAPMPPVM